MTGYLSKFIPRYASLTKPLRDLTRTETNFQWGPAQGIFLHFSTPNYQLWYMWKLQQVALQPSPPPPTYQGKGRGKTLNSRYGGYWRLGKVFFNGSVSTIFFSIWYSFLLAMITPNTQCHHMSIINILSCFLFMCFALCVQTS